MELMGEWYRDKVLNQTDLVEVEMPRGEGEIRIESELFCWRLYKGKKYIECETEEEARYLKVWLNSRQSSIFMPRDLEYLKSVLADLEDLKLQTDEIIEDRTDGIISYSYKEKLLNLVWYKSMQDSFDAEEKVRERLYPVREFEDDEDSENFAEDENDDNSTSDEVEDRYIPPPRYEKREKPKPQGKQLKIET